MQDDDGGDDDDLIGSAVLNQRQQSAADHWAVEEWLPLSNAQGRTDGEVQVRVAYDPTPPLPVRRAVVVTVL